MNLKHDYLAGEWGRYKNGKIKYWVSHPVTWLRKCDHCGFVGSPKRVAYRSECYVSEWPDPNDIDLCMPCWNRFRVLVKVHRMIGECKYLINKLRRLSAVPRSQACM